MSNTWTTGVQPGYRTKVIRYGNCTITVHRPELSDAERARREGQVMDAAAQILQAAEKRKAI